MNGLDTNVLIRFLVRDDADQAAAADAFLGRACSRSGPCLINRIVLCELVWMLDRGYRYRRGRIATVIESILRTEEFVVENAAEAWAALKAYRDGRADFADGLIGRTNAALGCATTATFDKRASRLDEFTLVGPANPR
jgi:predicted nucleic-acid-binding protein